MKKIIRYIQILLFSTVIFLGTGCESNFLDINKDPNNPTIVPLRQLLPYAQLNITNSLGMGPSGLSEPLSSFSHQIVVRDNWNSYFIVGDDFPIQQAWDNLYAGAFTDLRQIINLGTEQEAWQFVGIAQILKAYAASAMVDVWGDIPYTNATLGAENPYPEFDKGQEIYPKLFALLDEGIANLAKTSSLSTGTSDLFFSGNVDRWRKLAKTLKLKLYNQIQLTSLYDDAAVKALIAEGDLMSAASNDFELRYGSTTAPENRHPSFIQEYVQGPQYNISPYFYQIMQGKSTLNPILFGIEDPRIPYYFFNQLTPDQDAQNPVSYRDGAFLSIWFASLNIDPNEGFDQDQSQTMLGLYPVGGKYDDGEGGVVNQSSGLQGAGYQRLFTYANSLYVRAELALTKNTGEDAEELFEQAITESFKEVNQIADLAGAPTLSTTEISSYASKVLALYTAANTEKKLELILTEKWIANFGFGLEAYNDIRRTGYPKPFDPNTDNNPFTVLNRSFILSLPYSVTDLQINPNAPAPRNIATDKVFWDVD
ncbi:SusD/RagB family nutrient-binding outer membrane lipoprotein [Xanthocytophaga flava]|uniref:SusD/RagB family nutrient-binding outer membrane lipoprotein n=1 Tax=Xanthocytophaga flava TaxID=3048013 RepID=UPI0028D4EE62|nr:SusD/RagB family nutrient-binding outer membrane lipoprotein [Xanthocytophaga flavus]MDJ1468374.1 SusD/RagB family nutrient-binding outer membrane lipoprotein [Xanthocytophaga flavus]